MQEHKKLSQFVIDQFLRSDRAKQFKLNLIQRSILMALANRITSGTECYPSKQFLAEYLGTSIDNVKRAISSLVKNNLITLYKKPSKNKRSKFNRHNYYAFTTECIVPLIANTIQCTQHPVVEQPGAHSPVLYDNRVHTALQMGAHSTPNISINKSIKENREREPLSDFEISEANKLLCIELKLNEKEELESFRNRHKGEKNDYEFCRWLKNSYNFKNKPKVTGNGSARVEENRPKMRDFTEERLERERIAAMHALQKLSTGDDNKVHAEPDCIVRLPGESVTQSIARHYRDKVLSQGDVNVGQGRAISTR